MVKHIFYFNNLWHISCHDSSLRKTVLAVYLSWCHKNVRCESRISSVYAEQKSASLYGGLLEEGILGLLFQSVKRPKNGYILICQAEKSFFFTYNTQSNNNNKYFCVIGFKTIPFLVPYLLL